MADDIILTRTGKKKLEAELDQLRSVEMPALSERIRQARALGDLSENFDYQDAKRQQGFIAGRIKDIEVMLQTAVVVEEANPGSDTIGLSSVIRLLDLAYDEEAVYTLVGANEADPSSNLISVNSPIGKALMGRRVGDRVVVTTPGGASEFEVLSVE